MPWFYPFLFLRNLTARVHSAKRGALQKQCSLPFAFPITEPKSPDQRDMNLCSSRSFYNVRAAHIPSTRHHWRIATFDTSTMEDSRVSFLPSCASIESSNQTTKPYPHELMFQPIFYKADYRLSSSLILTRHTFLNMCVQRMSVKHGMSLPPAQSPVYQIRNLDAHSFPFHSCLNI